MNWINGFLFGKLLGRKEVAAAKEDCYYDSPEEIAKRYEKYGTVKGALTACDEPKTAREIANMIGWETRDVGPRLVLLEKQRQAKRIESPGEATKWYLI